LRDRPDRFFCLPLLWRVYEKRGGKRKAEHRTKPRLAADLVRLLSGWLPGRQLLVVADGAYISKGLLHDRPANVEAIGPLCWKAALWQARPGQRPSSGRRLPTPAQLLADDQRWPAETRWITFPNGCCRRLHLKQIDDVCWPSVAGASTRSRYFAVTVMATRPGFSKPPVCRGPPGAMPGRCARSSSAT
jgi:hypothetical protein